MINKPVILLITTIYAKVLMNILIEVPTWLGDCVMATPAIENIIQVYPKCCITIFGSKVASAVFTHHPQTKNIIIDNSRVAKNRYWWLYKQAKQLKFDVVFSFRRQFSSHFFAFFVSSQKTYYYQRYDKKSKHQVMRYNDFVNHSLKTNLTANRLKIYQANSYKCEAKILGINPGASYGSAKRWYPEEFAKVANELSDQYDIVIFGGSNEIEIAHHIEQFLIDNSISNYQNLAGKTNVSQLIDKISQLSLLITGDSGAMHVAAAFSVPTVAIFGPTKDTETSQWMNEKSVIVKRNLDCQPCMKRICPLKGQQQHQCMKQIKASDVLRMI